MLDVVLPSPPFPSFLFKAPARLATLTVIVLVLVLVLVLGFIEYENEDDDEVEKSHLDLARYRVPSPIVIENVDASALRSGIPRLDTIPAMGLHGTAMTPPNAIRLPAEWEPQDAALLAWPREDSLWQPYLEEARTAVADIAARLSRRQRVILAAPTPAAVGLRLQRQGADLASVALYEVDGNDIWARDFGPLTVFENGRPVLLDFGFNGWGLKYRADRDNQVTRRLAALGAFGRTPLRRLGLILEGGALESDGQGTLLTTALCQASANRNPHLDRAGLESELQRHLGAQRVLWLENGHLAGDDTDGHVDTLARFAPGDTLVFTHCSDARDEHNDRLEAMEEELRAFRTLAGRPYRLIPLPWPRPLFDAAGQRLPATYANFLVINGAVLVPAYGDPADLPAQEAVGSAFPDREIVPVDCSSLIRQRGAVHCLTMQLPRGVLG